MFHLYFYIFQVRELILIHWLYSGDVLESFEKLFSKLSRTSRLYDSRIILSSLTVEIKMTYIVNPFVV